ncbi:MAG: hypothetical protein KatS3mg087_0369 [Patescibacteria group bacterium]|nr:MAG: hypothetical protein KatS3mg087_0369 [Patescibacteria group bacterium]
MAKKWFIFTTLSIVAIILATAGYYNFYYKKTVRQNQESHNTSTRIASIGSENIYQSNLDLYKQKYSGESEDQLWQRLKHDSARLQYGATLGILNLDTTFYNSATWDLPKRLDHVNKVTVAQQAKKKIYLFRTHSLF